MKIKLSSDVSVYVTESRNRRKTNLSQEKKIIKLIGILIFRFFFKSD